jgi:hypothetical protein
MNRVRPDGAIGPGPEDNYAVWPKKGRLIKVEYGNPPSTHYMPSDDTNPAGKTNGELSYHAALSYGTKNIKSDAGALGPNPAYLTNDQWDFIGENNLRNDDKNGTIPNNPADEAACKRRGLTFPPAKPTASAGGGPELLYGDLTVFHGPDERAIGYAAATSMHQAGGYMIEGSTTVFVDVRSSSFQPTRKSSAPDTANIPSLVASPTRETGNSCGPTNTVVLPSIM